MHNDKKTETNKITFQCHFIFFSCTQPNAFKYNYVQYIAVIENKQNLTTSVTNFTRKI